MVAQQDDPGAAGKRGIEAGFVGRPHGLDGSFHVAVARPRLLTMGGAVTVEGRPREIVRLAGTDARPIVRLAGVEDRAAAEALRGRPLMADAAGAPALGADEFWSHDLEGCRVSDGEQMLGRVRRLLELPSCEVLEVERPAGGDLLVPMVRDAIRSIDVAGRQIEVDSRFLGVEAQREPGREPQGPGGDR